MLTMASAGRKHGPDRSGYYAYFSTPTTTMRTLLGTLAEIARETHQAAVSSGAATSSRVHRGGPYPLLRSFTTVITRDVIIATLVGDMRAGRSVVYADFVGYDEVAHHSGVERYDALETLRRLDREFARLERAAPTRPAVPPGRPVRPRPEPGRDVPHALRRDLAAVVERAIAAPTRPPARPRSAGRRGRSPGLRRRRAGGDRGRARGSPPGRPGGPAGASRPRRTRPSRRADDRRARHEAVVLASGNCGLVYLTHEPTRMTPERIDELYPRLLPTLREHPGIGFLLVRSEARGAARAVGAAVSSSWPPARSSARTRSAPSAPRPTPGGAHRHASSTARTSW